MPKWHRLRHGYRTAAVKSREGRCGPDGCSGGPSTVHTATATRADVRMVQATSRFRIRPKSAGRSSRLSCTATSDDPMNSFTGENSRRICEPMSGQRIEPACPVKTISKASPTWVASMVARPASPSRRPARAKGGAMKTSWQSATPVKPIARQRRPTKNSAALRPAAIVPGTANLSCRYLDPAGGGGRNGG